MSPRGVAWITIEGMSDGAAEEGTSPRFLHGMSSGVLAIVLSVFLALVFGVGATSLFGTQTWLIPMGAWIGVLAVPLAALCGPGGRPLRAASVALWMWSAYLYVGAGFFGGALGVPGEVDEPRGRGCGFGVILVLLALVAVPIAGAVTATVAGAWCRWVWPRFTQTLAFAMVLLALAVFLANARRVLKGAVPEEAYYASLPVVARLSGDDASSGCIVTTEASIDPAATRALVEALRATRESVPCEGARVRRDALHDYWIVETANRKRLAWQGPVAPDGLRSTAIFPSDVIGSLRPPTSWAISQALGTLLALALVAVAWRTRRRADVWRSARAGDYDGDGTVTFRDGTAPARFVRQETLRRGPVLVLSPTPAAPTYREPGGVGADARLRGGDLATLLREARTRAADLDAFAILTVALTVAPMLAETVLLG
jgi:hypothetical protein